MWAFAPEMSTKFWGFAAGMAFGTKQIFNLMSWMHDFHPGNSIAFIFMKITSFITIGLQISNCSSSKCFKNCSKSSFLTILSYQYGFWKIIFSYLTPFCGARRCLKRSRAWSKSGKWLPKNVKFHFCLVFCAILQFYQQF